MGRHTVGPAVKIYRFLALAPAPLFFIGFLWSVLNPPALCSGFPWEMPLMWSVMFLAHLAPWILLCQQLYLTRNA